MTLEFFVGTNNTIRHEFFPPFLIAPSNAHLDKEVFLFFKLENSRTYKKYEFMLCSYKVFLKFEIVNFNFFIWILNYITFYIKIS